MSALTVGVGIYKALPSIKGFLTKDLTVEQKTLSNFFYREKRAREMWSKTTLMPIASKRYKEIIFKVREEKKNFLENCGLTEEQIKQGYTKYTHTVKGTPINIEKAVVMTEKGTVKATELAKQAEEINFFDKVITWFKRFFNE
jgi:hypothetical protein